MVPQCKIGDFLSLKEVIFNNITPNARNLEYLFFLVAKYHVYRKRCSGLLPNIQAYKNEVYLMRNIENYNAVRNDKIDKHNQIWYNVQTGTRLDVIADDIISDYVDNMQ